MFILTAGIRDHNRGGHMGGGEGSNIALELTQRNPASLSGDCGVWGIKCL